MYVDMFWCSLNMRRIGSLLFSHMETVWPRYRSWRGSSSETWTSYLKWLKLTKQGTHVLPVKLRRRWLWHEHEHASKSPPRVDGWNFLTFYLFSSIFSFSHLFHVIVSMCFSLSTLGCCFSLLMQFFWQIIIIIFPLAYWIILHFWQNSSTFWKICKMD